MRKKLTVAVIMAAAALSALAEGYQVNTFSAKQEGMGHVGVAMKLGAESQIFNPAGVAFMGKTLEVSAGMSAISSHVTGWVDGGEYKTQNPVSTPMNVSAAFRILPNLYAGVALYTPYGSGIDWGINWPGAVLSQSCSLKVYDVQPTVSWRILPNLSIGAGLQIAWGSVNLSKGLVSAASMDKYVPLLGALQYGATNLQNSAALLQYYSGVVSGAVDPTTTPAPTPAGYTPGGYEPYGEVSPANVNLNGKSEIAVGYNVGIMWDVIPSLTLGASFRSRMNMHVKAGDVKVEYANMQAEALLGATLNNLNSTNFDASMPCPYVLTFGVAYKPIPRLTLAFDAQLNGWNAYKTLDIAFANQEKFNQHLTKDYHNAMTYHFGAQFATTSRLDLRAGLMVDTNPCNVDFYNPETPGTTKWEPSVGLSFRPVKGLSIDFAFMYVHGKKMNNTSAVYDDFMAKSYNENAATYNAGATAYNQAFNTPVAGATLGQVINATFGTSLAEAPLMNADQPTNVRVSGSYKVHAFIPAIGVSYSF